MTEPESKKSDVKAKKTYCAELKKHGYADVAIIASPADIRAKKKRRNILF